MRDRFFLRRDTITAMLDRQHLSHKRFADHLGLSRPYWSQIYNRRRHLTPMVREVLLASRYLKGFAESELWDIYAASEAA